MERRQIQDRVIVHADLARLRRALNGACNMRQAGAQINPAMQERIATGQR